MRYEELGYVLFNSRRYRSVMYIHSGCRQKIYSPSTTPVYSKPWGAIARLEPDYDCRVICRRLIDGEINKGP